jgi:hypothetical protein
VLTYVTPLVVASFYAFWVLSRRERQTPGWGSLAVSGLIMLVAVGYSETVGSLLVSALAGSLVLVLAMAGSGRAKANSMHLLAAGLVGGILGLTLVAMAPGNAARQGLLTPTTDPAVWITETVRNAYIFSVKTLRSDSRLILLASAIPFSWVVLGGQEITPAVSDRKQAGRPVLLIFALPVFVFGLVMACMAPTQYAMSSYPDGRILISAQFSVALAMVVWGVACGLFVRRRWPLSTRPWFQLGGAAVWLVALLLLGASSLQSVKRISAPLADARDFASRWDERAAKVAEARQAGDMNLEVASLTHMGGLDEIALDPKNWVNQCFAQAYRLHQVTAK